MIKRVLKFKLLCGLEGYIPLDSVTLSEIDSANQFIECVYKYKVGIRKFNDRNPSITWSPTIPLKASNLSLDEIIHDIINSRKYLILPNIKEDNLTEKLNEFDQLFELDFSNETISFYKKDIVLVEPGYAFNIRGTMHINTMFSNWKDIFYNDLLNSDHEKKLHIELDDTLDITEDVLDKDLTSISLTPYDLIKSKMKDSIDENEYDLWDTLFSTDNEISEVLPENSIIEITYSGAGDSGDVDSVLVITNTDDDREKTISLNKLISIELYNEIYSLIWKVIESKEDGFYNNDGGYGKMKISLTKFSWEHYNYFVDENQSISLNINLEDEKVSSDIKTSMLNFDELDDRTYDFRDLIIKSESDV